MANERTGENPWGVKFQTMFHMSNDSGLFINEKRDNYSKLYVSRMIHQYDHRWASFINSRPIYLSDVEKQVPTVLSQPQYWVPLSEVNDRLQEKLVVWLIVFRNTARSTDERTAIFSIIPKSGVGNNAPILLLNERHNLPQLSFYASIQTFLFDYVCRNKIGGLALNFFILEQLTVLPPFTYSSTDFEYVIPRVIELTYTAVDLQQFADEILNEIGLSQWNVFFPHNKVKELESPQPFLWDVKRRAILRAELDAYYARLYGLNRKQLRYILDPADLTPHELEDILDPWEEVADPLDPAGYAQRVAASDFPGETFRVLKEKEIRQYGEYRTRRLVLEAWDRLEGVEVGNPDGHSAQSIAVPPKQETISMVQPRSESRPAAVQTQLPASAKPNSPVTPPAKVEKEIDPPVDQPTLSDFGLYKCEVCGKMVMGFEKGNHEQEKHGGKSVEWKKVR